MLDKSLKFMYAKSELLILSTKQDIGQSIQKTFKNLKKSEVPTKTKWWIIRVGVSNIIKLTSDVILKGCALVLGLN